MQVFMQKNDVCLQNFIFLHKRLLFAGLCERIFEVGLPLAMSVPSKLLSEYASFYKKKCKFSSFYLKISDFFCTFAPAKVLIHGTGRSNPIIRLRTDSRSVG